MKKIKLDYLFIVFGLLTLMSCSTNPDPQKIIDKTITASGADRFEMASIAFDFRDKHYKGRRTSEDYKLTRRFKSSSGEVYDVMTSDFFQRSIDRKKMELEDSMIQKFKNSINSVFYFVQLPYGLNDQAVNKKYLGKVSINDNNYHKIEVTFDEQGGGEDFEDVYIYWINTLTHKIDFLAYSYEVNGGGLRFREAYNERLIKGIRFVDYINYEANPEKASVYELDKLYENKLLKELSRIEINAIAVHLTNS